MIQLLAGGKAVAFLGGTVVGALALPVLKSKVVRKVAVSTLATGLSVKEQAETTWNILQEGAEDLYEDAKQKKREKDLKDLNELMHFDFDGDFDWGDDDDEDPFADTDESEETEDDDDDFSDLF